MTEEQQQIAIAEACGEDPSMWSCPKCGKIPGTHVTYDERCAICDAEVTEPPDYLHDLNAMHEAEKVLTVAQGMNYVLRIGPMATAAQRAEAILRTIGKWEEA